jgi:hypothetical protein
MGLTAGKKDHAEPGAAGAPGSEMRGSAGTNTGTSRVRSGGDGATRCWSPALVNKGMSTQGPQWSAWEAIGAPEDVQRLSLAGSKAMCPSAPIHKTKPPAPMGMRRQQARQRAVREDRSPFIGSPRT